MSDNRTYFGGVRDVIIVDATLVQPLAVFVDRHTNDAQSMEMDLMASFEATPPIKQLNLAPGLVEFKVKHDRAKGYDAAVKLELPHPNGRLLRGNLPLHCMVLLSPYNMPKGFFYILGDVQQPIMLEGLDSDSGGRMTDAHVDVVTLKGLLKRLPPSILLEV